MHLSVFSPASPEAADLLWLWNACMYVCGFILAVVAFSMLYILVRYRKRDEAEPAQITGTRTIEMPGPPYPSRRWHSCSASAERRSKLSITARTAGGHRGPELSSVGDRLNQQQITLRILKAAYNMPSFASSLKPQELSAIVAFLTSRNPSLQAQNASKE